MLVYDIIFFSYVRLTLVSVCAVRCTMLMTYDFVPGLLCSVQLYHSRFTYAQLNEFVMKKKKARFLAAIPEVQ